MSKHTPGRWVVLDMRPDDDALTVIEASFMKQAICRIKNEVSKRELNDEDLANARLIAASPDLLEACELLVSEIYALTEDETLNYELVKNHQSMKFAEAAIKKAEGSE